MTQGLVRLSFIMPSRGRFRREDRDCRTMRHARRGRRRDGIHGALRFFRRGVSHRHDSDGHRGRSGRVAAGPSSDENENGGARKADRVPHAHMATPGRAPDGPGPGVRHRPQRWRPRSSSRLRRRIASAVTGRPALTSPACRRCRPTDGGRGPASGASGRGGGPRGRCSGRGRTVRSGRPF